VHFGVYHKFLAQIFTSLLYSYTMLQVVTVLLQLAVCIAGL